jgi:phosphatidylserine decarboxylase precursor
MGRSTTPLALLLCLLVAASPAAALTLKATINVTTGSVTFDGTTAIITNTSTAFGAAITWFASPESNADPSAWTTYPGNATVVRIAPGLWRAAYPEAVPYVSFVGGSASTPIYCAPMVEFSFGGVSCTVGNDTTVTLSAGTYTANPEKQHRYEWLGAEFTLTAPDTLAAADLATFKTLVIVRAQKMLSWASIGSGIYDANEVRKDDGRLATAFLFLMIAAAMLFLVMIMGLAQGWVGPHWCNQQSIQWNTLWWTLLFLVIVNAASIAGGFAGWLASFAFVVVHLFCVFVYYNMKAQKDAIAKGEQFWDFLHYHHSDPKTPSSSWTEKNASLGWRQKQFMFVLSLGVIALLIISLCEVYAWDSIDYQVFERYTQKMALESQPGLVGKTALMMYSFDSVATVLQFNVQTEALTKWCGEHYDIPLKTDAEREESIGHEFIKKYDINMNDYSPSKATDYETINKWFVRKLAPGARPVPFPNDTSIVGSPADARLIVYPIYENMTVWIKNESFTPFDLLGGKDTKGADTEAKNFEGGSIAIVRLAPADYHRFHAPVDGTLESITAVSGTYLSVNADAATSENHVYYNLRKVAIIDNTPVGRVAYIAIGATCVGSVSWTAVKGQTLKRGDEYGFMAFGGSTVIMLFQKGKVTFENDVLLNSQRRVETLVRVHTQIAKKN